MSQDQSFEEMLEESLISIHRGEVIEGTVISVNSEEIYVNIGYKSDGIIPKNEYSNFPAVDLTKEVEEGQTIRAKVLKVNDGEGQVLLTYKRLQAEEGLKKIEEYYKEKKEITSKVNMVLSGGLIVVVDEVRVFIPASLVSDEYVNDLNEYKDQEITFVVTEVNTRKNRIIGNRRVLLEKDKKARRDEVFEQIAEGDVMEGTVKNITDYGAFVDLGGIDGLVHISELSWSRIKTPKDVVKVGQKVKVKIIGINQEKKKISLSMKFKEDNPWNNAEEKYAEGTVVEGRVARMTDFGAFVELEVGIDALLHVSQISIKHVEKPKDVLKLGEVIKAKVTELNIDSKKISISKKVLEIVDTEEVEEVVEVAEAKETTVAEEE